MERDIRAWGRRLVRLINSLTVCSAALFFVLGTLSARFYEAMPGLVWPGLIGAGILVMNLLSLLYLGSRPGQRLGQRYEPVEGGPILSHQGESTVQVSLEALSQGLMMAGQSVPGLSRLQIKIERPTRRKILITAGFQVVEATQLQELGSQLHKVLAERFAEMITLDKDNQAEFQIVFEGYSGKVTESAAAKGIPPLGSRDASETPHFTGPRYPVDPGEDG